MDVQKRIKDLMELRGWTDYRKPVFPIPQLQICSTAAMLQLYRPLKLYAEHLALRCLSSLRILKTMRRYRNRGCYFQNGVPLPQSREKSCLTLWIS